MQISLWYSFKCFPVTENFSFIYPEVQDDFVCLLEMCVWKQVYKGEWGGEKIYVYIVMHVSVCFSVSMRLCVCIIFSRDRLRRPV